ncbi:MAG: hypothetical protein M3Q55_17665 [Acidobacteriota bacterium]|nr:hypothetical protein [Acidobacteriota bacterium]
MRILGLLTALCLLAVGEALLVMYFQRLTLQAKEHVDQRAQVRDVQSRLELALLEMKSAARDSLRHLDDDAELDAAARVSAARMKELKDVTRDPQQQRRLAQIESGLQAWRAGWRRPDRSVDGAVAITELEASFGPLRADLAAFRLR